MSDNAECEFECGRPHTGVWYWKPLKDYEETLRCDECAAFDYCVREIPDEEESDDGSCGTCGGSGGGDYPMHCTACGGSGLDRYRSRGRDEEPPDRDDDYWDPRWEP